MYVVINVIADIGLVRGRPGWQIGRTYLMECTMAGFKVRRAFYAKLDAYGQERIFEELMMGTTIKDLCDLFEASAAMFHYWIRQDPDRQRVYREMRLAMADGLVDEALEIADNSTPQTLGQDRERIRIRTWLAERWNRQEYGAPSAAPAGLTLNVGELHLTALKQGPLNELPPGDSVAVEGEVVP